MKFKVIFFLSLFFFLKSNYAFTQPLKFACDGEMTSANSTPSKLSFDMAVVLNPASMFDYPNRIALGCVDGMPDSKEKCQSSDSRIECKCENSIVSSTLILSRYTGKLEGIKIWKKDSQIFQLKAQCRPISKKMF